MDKTNLLENVVKLNIKSRPKSKEGEKKKKILTKVHALYQYREVAYNAFRSGIFLIKEKKD